MDSNYFITGYSPYPNGSLGVTVELSTTAIPKDPPKLPGRRLAAWVMRGLGFSEKMGLLA
jgi:hypothetical protein